MTHAIVEGNRSDPIPLVVIGGSAGALEPLTDIIGALPPDLDACVLVVIHTPRTAESALPRVLGRLGTLPASHAADGEPLVPGRVLVAPPDHHLTVVDGVAHVRRGPSVNRSRPAIDPLFQSASLHGSRTIGVILSGALDDGAAGLAAIARAGGRAVVQAPEDATYPSMPQSALERTPRAAQLPRVQIGPHILEALAEATRTEAAPMAGRLEKELSMTELEPYPPGTDEIGARASVFGCPSCGGTLWELDEGSDFRFRCRVGHAFSPRTLLDEQSASVEDGLWVALRALEEQASLARRLAAGALERGERVAHERFEQQAGAAERNAEAIRNLLRLAPDEPAEARTISEAS